MTTVIIKNKDRQWWKVMRVIWHWLLWNLTQWRFWQILYTNTACNHITNCTCVSKRPTKVEHVFKCGLKVNELEKIHISLNGCPWLYLNKMPHTEGSDKNKKIRRKRNHTYKSKARWVKDTARSARLRGGVKVTAWSQTKGKTCSHKCSAKAEQTNTTTQAPDEH